MKEKIEVRIGDHTIIQGTFDPEESSWSIHQSRFGTSVSIEVDDAVFVKGDQSLAVAKP